MERKLGLTNIVSKIEKFYLCVPGSYSQGYPAAFRRDAASYSTPDTSKIHNILYGERVENVSSLVGVDLI
jgi:hypothetical protein